MDINAGHLKFAYYMHPQKYFNYFTVLLLLLPAIAVAQTEKKLVVLHAGNHNVLVSKKISDSSAVQTELNKLLTAWFGNGYLAADLEMQPAGTDSLVYVLKTGEPYKWLNLRKGNAEEEVITMSGYREKFFLNKPFRPAELKRLFERTLTWYENNGYPFASIRLDSVQVTNGQVAASLRISKNQQFRVDSIEIEGSSSIKRSYMYNYSSIKPGSLYNENLVRQLDRRINQLPFARVTRPLKIYFTGDKARIVTFVDQKKASQADGILGVAPASTINNKLVLSGEANLNLQNLFGSGKSLEFHYRSFLAGSQDLKARIVYPYLFNTVLGVDYNFALLKFDSLYLQVENDFGIQYSLGGVSYIKAFYNVQNTSLLTVDTIALKASKRLPNFADMHNNLYGLALKVNRLDYTPNPRKGFLIESSLGAGIKHILRNNTINAIQFTDASSHPYTLYDSIQLRSVQYKITAALDCYWPLAGKSVLRTQLSGGSLNTREIFTNELFRIGGIRTLKGFDEQSIFATTYSILNLEYRYLLSANSNLILFGNGAWYERATRQAYQSDTPWGFGAGANFETGAGVFSLYYALGHQFNNPIQLRQAKIHFGIVNYF